MFLQPWIPLGIELQQSASADFVKHIVEKELFQGVLDKIKYSCFITV